MLETITSIELQERPNSHETIPAEEPIHHENTSYPTGIKFILLTLSIIFTIFLSALDSTIISTAIPSITAEFGNLNDIVWYSSAYSLTNFAFLSSWGKAYKYFPLKTSFLLAGVVFEIGNVICATAASSTAVIVGRAISGMGGAGIMSGAFIIIAVTAKPEYRAAYMGIVGVTFGCSGVVGPLLGGVLTDRASWRWCFWISLPIWATGAIGIFFSLRTSSGQAEHAVSTASIREKLFQMDFSGSLLASGSMICFITAMHWGGVIKPWSSAPVIGCLVSCVVLAGLFVVNERLMGDRAMVQGRLLRNSTFTANLIYVFFLAGLYFPLLYSLPIQFQSIDDVSASQSGVRLIPLVLGISIFTMISNGLVSMYRKHLPLTVLGAVVGTIGVALIYSIDETASTKRWIGYEIVTAIGVGLALQLPMVANQSLVVANDIPEATALTLFFENMGTTAFNAATEAAFTSSIVSSLADFKNVDSSAVIAAGAASLLRQLFSGKELQEVVTSYLNGCRVSHALSLTCGGIATIVSLGMAVPVMKEYLIGKKLRVLS
ncbi:efflux pump antibiotic resistance protein, putative [Talaromyces stipitatus ATCC 10500]|uniref:Efflux pump antibiotic resistance protein, putative n=1 Tax=Talaromyces stipitatus (strain ATCC 10500 / CBS 375.48 / QM 6759 / NRRL 1006) TaxID=441959 RepID=B8MJH0_TALSN|nr:efflux pump antibiotic resistance protein, putative [Talaromyces stipitatus ATCC 10500]EED15170.1 efflux pump antibiotic resistance protein, putative [Talaromyces stipitatus ATCC 10500]